jgi:carbamoyl-phosphate synthase large subunit
MKALGAAGIDVPATRSLDRASEVGFPCLLKPRAGRGSRGVHIALGPEHVGAYRALSGLTDEDVVAQELLPGQEWTVYVTSSSDGDLRAVVPMRLGLKRGITIRAETVAHAGIIDYCRRLHEHFPARGPFNVQLMESSDGRIAAFEVNPRVSTTLCLAVAAGADPIVEVYGSAGAGLVSFAAGLRLTRNWSNHFESA